MTEKRSSKKILFLFCSILVLLLNSCNTDYEYSSNPCYLIYDNSIHQNSVIASAMTTYSGVFVTISKTIKSGVTNYHFTSNQGTSADVPFNAIDQKRSLILGYNNGIIVGYGNSIDGIFFAYDLQCPNCYNPNTLPSRNYPLNVSANGIATCNTCKRKYDLNNRGLIISGDKGNKLTRYYCTTTGAYGILTVN